MITVRSSDLGVMPGIERHFSIDESLDLFRKMCLIRSFELNVKKAYDKKLIKGIPIYLSLGQESIAAALSMAFPAAVFGQHRAHDLYLAYGNDPRALIDELLGLRTGCANGMGGSASIQSANKSSPVRMFGHDGLMGSQVPIAVGYADATGIQTLAVMGDASAEEGFVLGQLGFASTRKVPILFVCIDNGLSILTKVEVRRSWKMADIAKGFGMQSVDIADDPWTILYLANAYRKNLPAFINIRTCRELWHAGTGSDGPPEWDRFTMVRESMYKLGLKEETQSIEAAVTLTTDLLWQNAISKRENE